MRKNIVVSALALIGAVAFTSCVRENFEPSGESQKGNGVNITVNTGSVDLKSYIEYDEAAGKYLPKWHKGDALGAYFVNASGANPASLVNANEDGTPLSKVLESNHDTKSVSIMPKTITKEEHKKSLAKRKLGLEKTERTWSRKVVWLLF